MGKIDKLVEGSIRTEDVFGTYSNAINERAYIHSLARLEPRARKAADVAISMFMRLFEPESQHATREEFIGRPVVFAHPIPNVFNDGGQIEAFMGVGKAMFAGRKDGGDMRMPYKEDLYPVGKSPDGNRMVVGQLIHASVRPKPTIPGIDDEIARLKDRSSSEPELEFEILIPERPLFLTVLAHADRRGVNEDLYGIAAKNQRIRDEAQDLVDTMELVSVGNYPVLLRPINFQA